MRRPGVCLDGEEAEPEDLPQDEEMAATAGGGDFRCVFLDGLWLRRGWDHEVKNVSVLVAIAGRRTATGPAVPQAE